MFLHCFSLPFPPGAAPKQMRRMHIFSFLSKNKGLFLRLFTAQHLLPHTNNSLLLDGELSLGLSSAKTSATYI